MRKMFLVFAIIFIASMASFAQSYGIIMTSKVITWTDSLQYQTDAVAGKDSVWVVPINFRCDMFRVYLDANSNSPVDSVGIELGARVYNTSNVCVDTTWGSYIAVKDSGWNTLNVLVNKSTGKDYSLYFIPPVDLMKFTLLNYRAAVPTRKVRVTLQGTKD